MQCVQCWYLVGACSCRDLEEGKVEGVLFAVCSSSLAGVERVTYYYDVFSFSQHFFFIIKNDIATTRLIEVPVFGQSNQIRNILSQSNQLFAF